MSSIENKSKWEKNEYLNFTSKEKNSTSKIFKEEKPDEEQISKQNKINIQKNENSPILNSSVMPDLNTSQTLSVKFNSKGNDLNSSLVENNKFAYFQSKKINTTDKKENVDKPCCCCTKTKCIKKYCECFSNNRYCKDCYCIDCMNKFIYQNNNNSKEISENEKIFCTCAKSNCNKKYCECYKSGKKCNDKCKCINCLNNIPPTFSINNNIKYQNNSNINDNSFSDKCENNNLNNNLNNNNSNIDLNEVKSKSRKSSISDDSNDAYIIQRISVFISQYQTLVNVERFTNEDMKLISKKRNLDK